MIGLYVSEHAVITLPWPARALHPNARVHHMVKAKWAGKARRDAHWTATAAGLRPSGADSVAVAITFFPPDNRRRDLDGMLGALKSSLDGIADALGVDDSRWEISMRKGQAKPPHGGVEVVVETRGGR